MTIAPREAEQFWHQCVLIVILVIAACARFYQLDYGSLSPDGLRNMESCDSSSSWLAMVMNYSDSSGMTPLYPTLLCQLTDWTSTTEFFVRLLSALAGLAAIYLLYITGRDFVSPTAGLLAASIMAADYQNIYIDRDASLYSLLLLCCLLHNYCFCRLFFSVPRPTRRPLELRFATDSVRGQWSWHPDFPGDARCLMGFWVSGALVFYTSPMALIQIASEVLASVFLVKKAADIFPNQRTALRTLWLPLLVALLPWLPIFYRYRTWVIEGNLFALQSPTVLGQQLLNLLPNHTNLQYLLVGQLLVFTLLLIVFRLLKKNYPQANTYYGFILFQLGFALLSLWLLPIASHFSYLFYWMLFVLLILIPAAISIDLIPSRRFKMGVIAISVVCILILQLNANSENNLYTRQKGPDFRLVASILHDDQEFMASNRKILMTSNIFSHHLEANGVIQPNITLLKPDVPLDKINKPSLYSAFYYLEYRPWDMQHQRETAVFETLTSEYKTLCTSQLPWLRIAKFSLDPVATGQVAPDCRDYLTDVNTYQLKAP